MPRSGDRVKAIRSSLIDARDLAELESILGGTTGETGIYNGTGARNQIGIGRHAALN